jgi:menaquinone-9 beta-reductase
MQYDVIIIGAGPGGLACAAAAAAAGLRTLVVERREQVGVKVCAGGITWNGLMQAVPVDLAERRFPVQHLHTPLQRATITAKTPIIATVNRRNLGQHMATKATSAGAELLLGYRLIAVDGETITCQKVKTGQRERLRSTFLIGADGSASLVRRSLGISVQAMGIGINYQLPGEYPQMQWHLDPRRFGSGYGWVFPHKQSASIGAYVDGRRMSARSLRTNLLAWGEANGHPLHQHRASAEVINFDYRGHRFGNTFLIGDAAGLASGLTGEGIYSAIVSGEAVADILAGRASGSERLSRLLRNHGRHRRMLALLNRSPWLAAFSGELVTLALRTGCMSFDAIEMAH